jgi:hypothetical protein
MPNEQQIFLAWLAWLIVLLVVLWTYFWKCLAFWKAARRDHIGWYILFALPVPFGLFEMIYVFWVAPRHPELGTATF